MNPNFKQNTLLPAIIQNYENNKILMLGWMNEEAFNKTIESKNVWFFSRSKNRLWEKGESSKNYLRIRETILRLISSKSNENNYYMFILHLIIKNLIKKSSFYLLEKKYLETTLEKEKELINFLDKANLVLNKENSYFDFKASPGDLLIFNEGGIHRGSKPSLNERVVLRYLYL